MLSCSIITNRDLEGGLGVGFGVLFFDDIGVALFSSVWLISLAKIIYLNVIFCGKVQFEPGNKG